MMIKVDTLIHYAIRHPNLSINRIHKYSEYYANSQDKIKCVETLMNLKRGYRSNFHHHVEDSIQIKKGIIDLIKTYSYNLESKEKNKQRDGLEVLINFFEREVDNDINKYRGVILVPKFIDLLNNTLIDENHYREDKIVGVWNFKAKMQGWVDALTNCLRAADNEEAIQYVIDTAIKNELKDINNDIHDSISTVHQVDYKPHKDYKYELYENSLNEFDQNREEAHKKVIKWFEDAHLSLKEYKINLDYQTFHESYLKHIYRKHKKRRNI